VFRRLLAVNSSLRFLRASPVRFPGCDSSAYFCPLMNFRFRPLMNGQYRHRGVKSIIVEREICSRCLYDL
jgi:hypothetical protein